VSAAEGHVGVLDFLLAAAQGEGKAELLAFASKVRT
jgi:hypothetical protein